jgi:transmembrane sensor
MELRKGTDARVRIDRSPDAEARRWYLLARDGELSPGQHEAFESWLASDANRAAYARVDRLWRSFDRLGQLKGVVRLEDLDRFAVAGAAATGSRSLAMPLRWVGAALAAGLALVFLWPGQSPDHSRTLALNTERKEIRTSELPDGSELVLGAGSKAFVSYTGQMREIRLLSGEAFFAVARDVQRPFVVRVGQKSIVAVGTKFEVRRRIGATAVAVAEGVVEVVPLPVTDAKIRARSAKGVLVRAGQSVEVAQDGRRVIIATDGADTPGSWRDGRFSYENEPLSQVIDDLNRYSSTPIVIKTPALAQVPVTGSFRLTDVRAILRQLDRSLPLDVEERRQETVVIPERDPTERTGRD